MWSRVRAPYQALFLSRLVGRATPALREFFCSLDRHARSREVCSRQIERLHVTSDFCTSFVLSPPEPRDSFGRVSRALVVSRRVVRGCQPRTARSRRAIASRERKAPRVGLQLPWRTWGASSRHDGGCRGGVVEARVRACRARTLSRARISRARGGASRARSTRGKFSSLAEFHVLPRRRPRGVTREARASRRRRARASHAAVQKRVSSARRVRPRARPRARGVASRRRRRDEERRLQERRRASSRRRPRATERPPSPAHRAPHRGRHTSRRPRPPGTTPTPTATTTTPPRRRPSPTASVYRTTPRSSSSATPPTPSSAPRPAPASPPSASPASSSSRARRPIRNARRSPVPRAVAGAPRDGLGVQRGLRDARGALTPLVAPPGASCSSPTGPSRDTSNSSPTPR